MTSMDEYTAIRMLTELVEVCRSGEFYQDHDRSMALLGNADKALAYLTPRLLS